MIVYWKVIAALPVVSFSLLAVVGFDMVVGSDERITFIRVFVATASVGHCNVRYSATILIVAVGMRLCYAMTIHPFPTFYFPHPGKPPALHLNNIHRWLFSNVCGTNPVCISVCVRACVRVCVCLHECILVLAGHCSRQRARVHACKLPSQ